MTHFSIYCDGSYSPFLKKIGIGGLVFQDDTLIAEFSTFFNHEQTSQPHELIAINNSLALAKQIGIKNLTIYTDSLDTVSFFNSKAKKTITDPYLKRTIHYIKDFDFIEFIKCGKYNKKFLQADILSKKYKYHKNSLNFKKEAPNLKEALNPKKTSLITKSQPTVNGKTVTWTKFLRIYQQHIDKEENAS